MGKGGEQNLTAKMAATSSTKKFALDHMPTEELRKWAKAYGVKEDLEREVLLAELEGYAYGIMDPDRPPHNFPMEPPSFTFQDVTKAIPAHCFQRSFLTSFYHVLHDLLIVAILGYLATWIGSPFLPPFSKYVLWPIYWYAQGSVLTGVWVLAHECGHQAFSDSEFVNNCFGTILHSALLVPYHSWRITHGKHHSNTGSLENDEVFCASTRSDWGKEMLRETPLAHLWGIIIMLTVGWMPGYLIMNATGPSKYRGKDANHFSPSAAFFKPEEYWLIVQSDIAWVMAFAALAYAIHTFGFAPVFFYYLVPYFITNAHLVLITFLQHTDVFVPHFREKEWSWFRGALCTVDRSYGILDYFFHRIADTHVCHHLYSKMPFYHCEEATEAIKKVVGKYYLKDDTPILKALWRSYKACQFVEDEGDCVYYKNVK